MVHIFNSNTCTCIWYVTAVNDDGSFRTYLSLFASSDVMCGLLHCVHLNEKLMFWRETLSVALPASFLTKGSKTYVCRSATLDVGLNMPDPGQVPDGAKCGHEKVSFSLHIVWAHVFSALFRFQSANFYKLLWIKPAMFFLYILTSYFFKATSKNILEISSSIIFVFYRYVTTIHVHL